jgi:hypothetical protein
MKIRLFLVILLTWGWIVASPVTKAGYEPCGRIQMAILLDTSGSMEGLIHQAKSQLWKIVNELATAERNGKKPRLEIALYEYGKSSIPASEGYLRMLTPFTSDLDWVSDELFKLYTNGGEEYCGQVIRTAVNGLKWSKHPRDYKLIVIAGTEPFTQGRVDYRQACREALAGGIVVNTIFCGDYREGIATFWKDGATMSGGSYLNIDHNQSIPEIDAPQDAEILRLNEVLNKTYLPYGRKGTEKQKMQAAQDSNALSMGKEATVQRSLAKASDIYSNSTWDLVDAVKSEGYQILNSLKTEEYPVELRKMSKEERKKHIQIMLKEREEVQKQLNQLNQERRIYVEKVVKNQKQDSLDTAVLKAIHQQAVRKGFRFETKK